MEMLTYRFEESEFLYTQLYRFIKEDILSGKLLFNEKLPSKRKLSRHLNLSLTTVEIAYQQLLDEGYIYSKSKVGYFVEDIQTINLVPGSSTEIVKKEIQRDKTSFKIEDSHIKTFPFQKFRKYARDAFEAEQFELLERGNIQGELSLRNEIRRYLYHSRGVNCNNEQIIVGSSTEQLFTLLTRILGKRKYYIENPGYPLIKKVLRYENKDYINVSVDKDGLMADTLNNEGSVVHVTPSHQFPTGVVLSAKRRTEILKWADEGDRYIIEDDYDSEFRYKGRPLKALQGMSSNDRVIYMSTFSKSIFPSIRVAYMVLPKNLLDNYFTLENKPNNTVPKHIQFMITAFLKDGEFERNINRMRKIYKKKLEMSLEAIEKYLEEYNIYGSDAGMHFVLETINKLNLKDIEINTIQDYYEGTNPKYRYQYIIGFGSFEDDKIDTIIKELLNH
ncbi:PLP-dependent aminotransferase family protein [Macrococcoides caseolyticum]|uniref:MocR-like pyridoxine biosynthesis transcription factor PdxR n=1 Tax=Macrococcoides caseolyticum TaxID=69966 RepID=UPI001F410B27|nr:PLP-dependent aminotransferase family protein [Macrococcus caseolyticus]MCE4957923.1 PLP-dependent aminotransferase family protein [Macrococcus caseolyticus]